MIPGDPSDPKKFKNKSIEVRAELPSFLLCMKNLIKSSKSAIRKIPMVLVLRSFESHFSLPKITLTINGPASVFLRPSCGHPECTCSYQFAKPLCQAQTPWDVLLVQIKVARCDKLGVTTHHKLPRNVEKVCFHRTVLGKCTQLLRTHHFTFSSIGWAGSGTNGVKRHNLSTRERFLISLRNFFWWSLKSWNIALIVFWYFQLAMDPVASGCGECGRNIPTKEEK